MEQKMDVLIRNQIKAAEELISVMLERGTIDFAAFRHVYAAQQSLLESLCIVDANINGDYQRYLKSDQWSRTRNLVLCRDGFMCQRCGHSWKQFEDEQSLDVHHITYLRRGEERLDDLVTLCRRCHEYVHRSGLFKLGRILETKEELDAFREEFEPLRKSRCEPSGNDTCREESQLTRPLKRKGGKASDPANLPDIDFGP